MRTRIAAILTLCLLASPAMAAESFYDRLVKIAKDVQALPAGTKPATATPAAVELEAKAKSCKPNDLPCEREARRLATKLDTSLMQDANMAKMHKETARLEQIEKIRAALMKQLNA
ncbi:hypothetical protein [Roseiterribacter gracilis]|uniref:Uncharacterized protein n=1 Tax=Roseiterribacter gracilis TaxID=2812848 RepID=A0A8S8XA45_9PROT|nr:hypothetical protein TMPK1_07260 [Rhodospirillales bacterium TMPK1]